MLTYPAIVQSTDHAAQVNCGHLSAYQGSRFPMLWTIPGVNHGIGISKTRHNALQGIFSSQTISEHHWTPQNALQVNCGGLNGIPAILNHGIPMSSLRFLIMINQYQYQLDNENSLSLAKSFGRKSWPRGRAGGRARAHT